MKSERRVRAPGGELNSSGRSDTRRNRENV